MDPVNNNQFEVKSTNTKRKITAPCPNAYLNPALDLLANNDPMCNTGMEILPNKKRKQTTSSNIAAFENSALDLGISKAAVNAFLAKELENVRRNCRYTDVPTPNEANGSIDQNIEMFGAPENVKADIESEPIYSNLPNACTKTIVNNLENTDNSDCSELSRIAHEDDYLDSGISVLEHKSLNAANTDISNNLNLSTVTNIQNNITNQVFVNNTSNLSLSFIDKLALDSPNISNRSLYLDDDLNESNIMEIKTITIITKKKRIVEKNTNPFLDPNLATDIPSVTAENPFLDVSKPESEYNVEALSRPTTIEAPQIELMPRRLFSGDTNSTFSTMNESSSDSQQYENIDNYRSESPVYENIDEISGLPHFSKQSKILGHDVSHFNATDIMNLNRLTQADHANDSNDTKKEAKHNFLKAGNRLSRKVFKTLKKKFKSEKTDNNISLNPYEVPRKMAKPKIAAKDAGIENPCLHLDNSDEIEIEELDEEHLYESVKTMRNTQLNMNVTPLREHNEVADVSHNKTGTPSKKVRFDSTLNQEKVITGNSFDYGVQSPGFDAKIDKYHDELENCINERKFLKQNM